MSNITHSALTFRSLSSVFSICAIALALHTPDAHALTSRQRFALFIALPTALVMTYACGKSQTTEAPVPLSEADLSTISITEFTDAYIVGQPGNKGCVTVEGSNLVYKKGKPRFGFFSISLKQVEAFFKNLKTIKEMCELANYFTA